MAKVDDAGFSSSSLLWSMLAEAKSKYIHPWDSRTHPARQATPERAWTSPELFTLIEFWIILMCFLQINPVSASSHSSTFNYVIHRR